MNNYISPMGCLFVKLFLICSVGVSFAKAEYGGVTSDHARLFDSVVRMRGHSTRQRIPIEGESKVCEPVKRLILCGTIRKSSQEGEYLMSDIVGLLGTSSDKPAKLIIANPKITEDMVLDESRRRFCARGLIAAVLDESGKIENAPVFFAIEQLKDL